MTATGSLEVGNEPGAHQPGDRNDPETDGGHTAPVTDRLMTGDRKAEPVAAPRTMNVTPRTRLPRPHWWPGGAAWVLWALAMLGMAATFWLHQLLVQAGRPELMSFDPLLLVAMVSAATTGAVVASRQPIHPVGWLLLAFAVLLAGSGVAAAYGPYGLLARPGALPAAGFVAVFYPPLAVAALACLALVLLLTPTGSLPSARWRWWAWTSVAVPVVFLLVVTVAPKPSPLHYRALDNPFDVDAFGGFVLVVDLLAQAVTILAMVVAAGSLVVRFRRTRGVERQQLRWVAFAAGLVAAGAVLALVGLALGTSALIGSVTTEFLVALLPVAIGAAVLRYRLFDLDRIISRTVSYGLLTLLLGGGYAVVVLRLGQLVGRDSSLVVAGATLAVAAAFQPARRRIQRLVDRRFNRRRHDAAQTIAAFNIHLRDQLDLNTLSAELLAVVDETMQPTLASLWLRPRAVSRP
jgi:hypothetical protein